MFSWLMHLWGLAIADYIEGSTEEVNLELIRVVANFDMLAAPARLGHV